MKKSKIIICLLSVFLFISVCLNIAFISADFKNYYRVTVDPATGLEYLHTDTDTYVEISQKSVDCNYFTQDTSDRIEHIYVKAFTSIMPENTSSTRKAFYWNHILVPFYDVMGNQTDTDDKLYCAEESLGAEKYFAKPGFEIPELKAENIEKIDLQRYGSMSDNMIVEGESNIEAFLKDYKKIFEDNSISDCYIKYKNASYVEWFNSYNLEEMLKK